MYLAIDTITSAAGITVFNEFQSSHFSLDPKMASENIMQAIDKMIRKAETTLADLKGVFVIKGPGSFKGLRVGISVANQFSHQLNIPILGLRTDEWWKMGLNPKILYLQSMNRDEVYMADEKNYHIIPLEELSELGEKTWVGELKFDHEEKMPSNLTEIQKLEYIGTTWPKAIEIFAPQLTLKKAYDLVEPFYGKEPKITLSRKK